ncbi:uncharacterized protein TNCV_3891751 [Trichonephila clavipes]|nr:uncharacterized protein TNCV_3891751 [Trichonephila clavipes]
MLSLNINTFFKQHDFYHSDLFSETGDIGAQRVIFIIGGIFMGITAHQIMTFRYLLQQFYFLKDKYHWQILNTACYFIGLFSITVLIIVIGFPARTEVTTHTVAAAVFFVGILLYTCYDCFLNQHVVQTHELIGRKLRILQKARVFLCIGQLLSCFLYLVIYPLAQEKWIANHEKRPAMKTPADEVSIV